MQQNPTQPSQEPNETWLGSRMGCWGLVILSIPAQFLAYAWLDVYMQGYESWRDSLWGVTFYLAAGALLATVATLQALPYARTQSTKRPVCVFIIARLLTISGVMFLPIALALAHNRQPKATEALYFAALVSVVMALLSGLALMRMWRWARVGVIFSVTGMVFLGGLVAQAWFRMTVTTPDDWVLLPFHVPTAAGRALLLCYLMIALPFGTASVWCLTRRCVVDAFLKERD